MVAVVVAALQQRKPESGGTSMDNQEKTAPRSMGYGETSSEDAPTQSVVLTLYMAEEKNTQEHYAKGGKFLLISMRIWESNLTEWRLTV